MPFAFLFLGVLLIVVAYNDSMPNLWAALKTDIPGFFLWGLALAALVGLGYIPGLKTPSRYLLALIFLVLFLKNGSGIVAGFQQFAASGASSTGAGAAPSTPAAAVASNPNAASIPSTATGTTAVSPPPPPPPPPNWLDPQTYLNIYSPSAGFGGQAETQNTTPVSQPSTATSSTGAG